MEHHNVSTEVIGFTTAYKYGGNAYMDWVNAGKPHNPGRLNDILYINYKKPSARTSSRHFSAMLQRKIQHENIDGEALNFAFNTMKRYSYKNKILIIISDCNSFDAQSTQYNQHDLLRVHMDSMIRKIQDSRTVKLVGISTNPVVRTLYDKNIHLAHYRDIYKSCCELFISNF
jgi:cobaltochelatase CobT